MGPDSSSGVLASTAMSLTSRQRCLFVKRVLNEIIVVEASGLQEALSVFIR